MAKCAWCGRHIDGEVYTYTYGDKGWYFCCDKHRQEHKQSHFGAKIAAKHAADERRAVAEQAKLEREKTLRAIDRKNEEERAYREAERRKDRSRWYPEEWVRHLVDRPEDAFQCPWDKLTGVEFAKLLSEKPDLVPTTINWKDRMAAEDWRSLLIKQPRFATVCQWAKLDGSTIFEILTENTSVMDYATDDLWKLVGVKMWAALIWRAPEFVHEFLEHIDIDKMTAAADGGDGMAAYIVSNAMDDDEDAAVGYARKSAEAGCKYGELYYAEILYGNSDPECVKWFEKASRQGMYRASAYLTLIYRFGLFGKGADASVAREFAQFDRDDMQKVQKHFGDGDEDLRKFYTSYKKVSDSGDEERRMSFLPMMWKCAYRVIKRDFGVDVFLAELKAAKQYGKKYMDAALGHFLDQDGQVRDDVDDKTKAFIDAYKAAKTECAASKPASDSERKPAEKKVESRPADRPQKSEAKVSAASSKEVKTPSRSIDNKANTTANKSKKKRWKFVLLGILFGWFGAHYMYAKRWFLLLLMLGSFGTGVALIDKSEPNEQRAQESAAPKADAQKKDASDGNDVIASVCLLIWLVMWLGGALFVKKDGKGNAM